MEDMTRLLIADVHRIVFPDDGEPGSLFRPMAADADSVVYETGEHYVTFYQLDDGRVVAYVELWHDEDPDHLEFQVPIESAEQVAAIVDDPLIAESWERC